MKNLIPIAVLLVLVADAAHTQAQRPGWREGRRGRRALTSDLLLLAMLPAVQDELDVSPQQEKYLDDLAEDHRNQRRSIIRQMRRSEGDDEPEARTRDFRQRATRLNEVTERLIIAVLEPQQAERLRQLRLQIEGVRALYRNDFLEQLNLTEAQKTRVRELLGDESSAPPRAELGDDLAAELMKVLTDEQKFRWEQLKGEGFSLPVGDRE